MHRLDHWFLILLRNSCHAYGEENQDSTTASCLQKSLSIYMADCANLDLNTTYNPNSRILIGLTVFCKLQPYKLDLWPKLECNFYTVRQQLTIKFHLLLGIRLVCYGISWLVYKETKPTVVERDLEINNEGYQADMEKNPNTATNL